MKKLTLILCFALAFTLTACADAADPVAETITIHAYNAEGHPIELEVPADPQRIAVLDMAALDILDAFGLGDRIVGSAGVSIDYLKQYDPAGSDGAIVNLGTVKTADLEKVALCDPDLIFIGRRLASVYGELEKIAPVIYLDIDHDQGVVESTRANAMTIASIFGLEDKVDAMFDGILPRINALSEVMRDKEVLLGMYNGSALGLMDSEAQFSIIAKELGAVNLGQTVGEEDKASHGEEASWETVIRLDPEYLFILDRNSAVGTVEEGLPGVRDVIENDLIRELDVYQENKIVYIIDNANIWYTAVGGIQALDTMLTDLEHALM